MKRTIIHIIFLTILSNSFAQTEWFYRDMINKPLVFKTPVDSFLNLSLIVNDKVKIGQDSINLITAIGERYALPGHMYRNSPIKSYVYTKSLNKDSMFVILSFCFDKLYSISLYAKGSYYVNNIRRKYLRNFDWEITRSQVISKHDSEVKDATSITYYGQRDVEFNQSGKNKYYMFVYNENYINGTCEFVIRDKEIQDRIPSWCGNSRDNNTWEKLKIFLNNAH